MLTVDHTNISTNDKVYQLPAGIEIYAKTLSSTNQSQKTAIFIHGGGSGGNHTIVHRPACWMLNKGLFSMVILPDRRGAGYSSPIKSEMTYADHAADMKNLLDAMGATGTITAIGISYGGPIALTLAAIDERVSEVMLVASSPSLKPAKGLAGFLYRKGLLEKIVKAVYSKIIGSAQAAYPDFDGSYDAKNEAGLKKIFMDAIKQMEKDRLESLLLENRSTCNLNNAGIESSLTIRVPVLRVIGTGDETWEVDLGDRYKARIPDIRSSLIDHAVHKDVFFRAEEFYLAISKLAETAGLQT